MGGRPEWTEPSDGSVTWVTVREAAKQAGVSESRVRGWYRAGHIRSRNRVDARADRRPQRRLVVVEDVLAQAARAKEVGRSPDRRPSDDVPGRSNRMPADRDEWHRLTARVEDPQRFPTELAAEREQVLLAEEERSLLRETLRELQRRVERLEHLYATAEGTTPSAVQPKPTDDAPPADPDVEVEWRAEAAPREPGRFRFFRRRDHRS